MKFKDVLKGKRAELLVDVPGYTKEDGSPFQVLLVPLTGLEWEAACADALARAKEKGVEKPTIGEPVYDLALQAFVLAAGCVDPDSPADARKPAFESGVEILEFMHPETIVYMHERHEVHQDSVSPYVHKVKGEDFMTKLREVAGPGGQSAFMALSLSTRLNWALSTSKQLLSLLEGKSSPSSLSSETAMKPSSVNSKKRSGSKKSGVKA